MTKTRDELIRYADGMTFEAAWRAYAGMVESGECTLEDLQCIKYEIYREVERYLVSKRLEAQMIRLPGGVHRIIGDDELKQAEATKSECSMLEWLETNGWEVIDDSQVEVFRSKNVDVLYGRDEWRVIVYTPTKARLVRYEMQFSINTPHRVLIAAIAAAI